MEKDYKTVLMEMKQEKMTVNEDNTVFDKEKVQMVEEYIEPKVSGKHKRSARHEFYHILHKMGLIQKHEATKRPHISVSTYVDGEKSEKIDLAYIKENRKI